MDFFMKVAMIVVNYNEAENTVKYVKKISEYENVHKIVVVDNASTELNGLDVLKEVQNEKVVMVESKKNGGYGYGNNFGVRYLEEQNEIYDYIIVSNVDIAIEESAIERCLQVLEDDEKIAIAAPRMVNAAHQPIRRSAWKMRTFWLDVIHSTRFLEAIFYKKLRAGEYSEKEYGQKILEVEAISGAFFIVKYPIFKEIDMFDENVFLFYEEDILAKKIEEKQYKIVSVNDVQFVHYESQTIGKTMNYYRKMKEMFCSKMYYHKTYNHIRRWKSVLFELLNIIRKLELCVEIPIRKILKK